jgi:NAD(P)-dependent dehydrogenase (short-subunit alcohol dehydrogenase family)
VGAAGSVGAVTSRSLADEGYDVVLLDAAPLDEVVARVEAVEGASARPIKVDLMDEATVASAAQELRESDSPLAVIVVVAAVPPDPRWSRSAPGGDMKGTPFSRPTAPRRPGFGS